MNSVKLIITSSLFVLIQCLFSSCGHSDEEYSEREHRIMDSITGKSSGGSDSAAVNGTTVSLKMNSSSKIEDTKGELHYDRIKITYDYDNKLFNKKSDIDGKIENHSAKTYEDFEVMISCYSSKDELLKSFTHTISKTVAPGTSTKFTIRFTDALRTSSVKIRLVKAVEVK